MSWFISLILAGSLITTGSNLPVSEYDVYENQGVPVFNKHSETERFEQTYPFNPNGRIQVSNLNGSIKIEAWDNPQIYLEAIKTADSKERLAEVEINIDADPNNFKVDTDYEEWNRRISRNRKDKRGNYGMLQVQFLLKVPRTAVLNEIETVNGSVSVSDMTNYTEVSAVNGAVKGTNLRGTAKLSTVNGSVLADFERLENKSVVALETVNGSVKLVIPSDVNAVIRADTLNGSIVNDFGLPVKKGEYVGRDLYGRIGSSGVRVEDYSRIKLSSVNGGLSIKRQNDGKTLNPATNLLPEDSSNDFDSDFEADLRDAEKEIKMDLAGAKKNIAEARREMRKAMRASRSETADALKNIPNEIKKINPEIERLNAEILETAVFAIDSAEAKKLAEESKLLSEAVLAKRIESQLNIPAVEQKNGSFSIKGIPTVKIEVEDVVVSVRGWDQPEVKYTLTKISKDQISKIKNKDAVTFTAEQNDSDEVAIEVINDSNGKDEYRYVEPTQVQLEVFVPKKSNLRIVTNDEVRLEGVTGEIDLKGKDKTMNLRDIKGNLILRAEDGLVRLIGFDGKLDSQIGDGEMFLEGDFQQINARADDGTITLTLPENTDADIFANTKRISGEGIELICECENSEHSENRWKLGQGGKDFNFEVEEGKIIIRSLSAISVGS